jgi:hypothetical protein
LRKSLGINPLESGIQKLFFGQLFVVETPKGSNDYRFWKFNAFNPEGVSGVENYVIPSGFGNRSTIF